MLPENVKSYAFTFNVEARAIQRLQQIGTVSVSTTPVPAPSVTITISDEQLAEARAHPQHIVVQVAKIDLNDEAALDRHFAEFAEEDRLLSNMGIENYAEMLDAEDHGV